MFIVEEITFTTYKQFFLCFHFIFECWNVDISYYWWIQCYELRLNLEEKKLWTSYMYTLHIKKSNLFYFSKYFCQRNVRKLKDTSNYTMWLWHINYYTHLSWLSETIWANKMLNQTLPERRNHCKTRKKIAKWSRTKNEGISHYNEDQKNKMKWKIKTERGLHA